MNQTAPTFSPAGEQRSGRVLVLTADEQLASEIQRALHEAAPGAQVNVARSLGDAQQTLMHERPDLFVLDLDATEDHGQEFLYDLRTSHPNSRAIILTSAHFAGQRERALGAVHFLEKPFPHGDFVTLAEALLAPAAGEKFQGTLSDLHIADIIQLKCISGSNSALEFTAPSGEKARVYFERGQVRHATAPGKDGIAAFNEIVNWSGGKISEVPNPGDYPRSIDLDWQVLLMEAVRKIDETRAAPAEHAARARRKVLVIDDSVMLLSFMKEVLSEANYEVNTAANAEEAIATAARESPDLILLDYLLPDMKGDEVVARLHADPATARARIVYMSGFGSDLRPEEINRGNVIGALNKPFTSDLLRQTVEKYMPEEPQHESRVEVAPQESVTESPAADVGEATEIAAAAGQTTEPWWSAPVAPSAWPETPPSIEAETSVAPIESSEAMPAEESLGTAAATGSEVTTSQFVEFHPQPEPLPATDRTFFCGDTTFFSLHWALQTIAKDKLTGVLRCFWDKAPVELFARNGEVVLVTTRDPELYCAEAPITLVNVDAGQTSAARDKQRDDGCPLFITLAEQGLVLHEPAMQLVQHYGQKLFAQLWVAQRVRFIFELLQNLPGCARDVSSDAEIDQWSLSVLRFIQYQELPNLPEAEPTRIPAYTADGYDRVQKLRLTVAEAQFASQFNGVRSLAQIGKNLRLDIKFARLTLFRFLALEIVECWPPTAPVKQERRGLFQKIGGAIGFGE